MQNDVLQILLSVEYTFSIRIKHYSNTKAKTMNDKIKAGNLQTLNEQIADVEQRLEKMENTDADYRKRVYPHVEITIEALDKKLKTLRHERILFELSDEIWLSK